VDSKLAIYFQDRFYGSQIHPYRHFESKVDGLLNSDSVILDAGCGRTTPVLRKYIGRASSLIGVELVDPTDVPPEITYLQSSLTKIPIPNSSVDIIISRSVFEHLDDPSSVYVEFERILKPGGHVIFLTANVWDYATIAARIVPNKLHGRIVSFIEGRAEEDVFPTQYKTNSQRAIRRLCAASGLSLVESKYLSQYPNYFMFSGLLFLIATAYEKAISKIDALAFLRGWLLVTLRK